MGRIVTRFAPSPTGHLHIGGLRTALFNYLYARANRGKFLLRIEDTDLARNSAEAKDAIIEAFEWVGMDYDDEVVYQSQRFALYGEYIARLLQEGKAYYCYMQKEELEANRKEAEAKGHVWQYDRRYRDFQGVPPKDVKPVVRIKAPLEGDICFCDGVKGQVRVFAKELDDFIIARSDGTPTYNFVVAIDDALMGVTDVIRGDDHLSNTPRQILVYQALGFQIPRFFHVPMILNTEGKKLSKRDGAMGVMEYKSLGYLPEALLNFLVRLGWSYGDQEIFSLQEMLELFDPDALNTAPSSYNAEKLLWLNAHYLNALDADSLNALLPFYGADVPKKEVQEILYPEIQERSKTCIEFVEILQKCLSPVESFDEKMRQKINNDANIHFFRAFIAYLEVLQKPLKSPQDVEEAIAVFADFQGLKVKELFMPLRYALLGSSGGVGIAPLIAALGVQTTRERIIKALESLQ